MTLAVGKLPPLGPGGFRFVTKALDVETGDNGRRRFRTIASSTVKDSKGDEVKLAALTEMRDSFRRGLIIFMDHKLETGSAFGMSDSAEIVKAVESDANGNPIYDLHISGFVDEANPRAVQLADSMAGGMRFGTSIGAYVRKHNRNKDGGMDIWSIDTKEASIVGVPINQRSWVQKAVSAVEGLEETPVGDTILDGDDTEETPVETAKSDSVSDTPVEATIVVPKEVIEEVVAEAVAEVTKGAGCPSCGKDANDECNDAFHGKTEKGLTEVVPSEQITTGGQEADDAATPETAPTESAPTDTPTEKAEQFAPEDVAALVKHVRTLIQTNANLNDEIVVLKGEVESLKASRDRINDERDDARDLISKALELPLRPKAQEYIQTAAQRYPGLDPAVTDYLIKSERGASNQ